MISMKPIWFSEELYSNEHIQCFKAKNVEVRLDMGTESSGILACLLTRLLFLNGLGRNTMNSEKYWE